MGVYLRQYLRGFLERWTSIFISRTVCLGSWSQVPISISILTGVSCHCMAAPGQFLCPNVQGHFCRRREGSLKVKLEKSGRANTGWLWGRRDQLFVQGLTSAPPDSSKDAPYILEEAPSPLAKEAMFCSALDTQYQDLKEKSKEAKNYVSTYHMPDAY